MSAYKVKVITLFPEIFPGVLGIGNIGSSPLLTSMGLSGAGASLIAFLIRIQANGLAYMFMILLVALLLGCYSVYTLVRLNAISALVHLSPQTEV